MKCILFLFVFFGFSKSNNINIEETQWNLNQVYDDSEKFGYNRPSYFGYEVNYNYLPISHKYDQIKYVGIDQMNYMRRRKKIDQIQSDVNPTDIGNLNTDSEIKLLETTKQNLSQSKRNKQRRNKKLTRKRKRSKKKRKRKHKKSNRKDKGKKNTRKKRKKHSHVEENANSHKLPKNSKPKLGVITGKSNHNQVFSSEVQKKSKQKLDISKNNLEKQVNQNIPGENKKVINNAIIDLEMPTLYLIDETKSISDDIKKTENEMNHIMGPMSSDDGIPNASFKPKGRSGIFDGQDEAMDNSTIKLCCQYRNLKFCHEQLMTKTPDPDPCCRRKEFLDCMEQQRQILCDHPDQCHSYELINLREDIKYHIRSDSLCLSTCNQSRLPVG